MDQTVLSFDQNLLEGLENTTQWKKLYLEQYRSKCVASFWMS